MKRRRNLMWIFTCTVLLFTAWVLWLTRGPMPQGDVEIASLEEAPSAGDASGNPAIGGDFTLVDQDGKTVHAADYKGKLMLVFFGFTHCPDICPMSMMTVTNVLNELDTKASQVVPILITVDPKRDTPQVMKDYIKGFHPSFVGLTGTEVQIKQAVDAYKVYASKAEPEAKEAPAHGDDHSAHGAGSADNYLMNHSGFIYLMDRDGKYLAHFMHTDPEQQIVNGITPHLN